MYSMGRHKRGGHWRQVNVKSAERDANMKEDEIGENKLSVTSVVRKMLILSTLVNRK